MTWEQHPFVKILVPFSSGICVFRYFEGIQSIIEGVFIGVLFLFLLQFCFKKTRSLFHSNLSNALFVFCAIFGLGFIWSDYHNDQNDFPKKLIALKNYPIIIGEVQDVPIIKNNKQKIKVKLLPESAQSLQAIVTIPIDSNRNDIKNGDQIQFESNKLKAIQAVYWYQSFDYANYQGLNNIYLQAYLNSEDWIVTGNNTSLLWDQLSKFKSYCITVFNRHIPSSNYAAIVTALTLGDKQFLQKETQQLFSQTGAMHILAVSGLHVGILYKLMATLLSLLPFLKYKKSIQTIIIVLILFLYACLTGLSPSVCRAGLMFGLIAIGNNFNQHYRIYNIIAFAAFINLLFAPYDIFTIGFQLSYAAVISIIYFFPKISQWYQFKNKLFKYLWELSVVSICAQIGTGAISLFYFNLFPLFFLLSNFVVIPLAFVLFIGGLLLILFSFLPSISAIIGIILHYALQISEVLLKQINYFDFSVMIATPSAIEIAFYFSGLILFVLFWELRKTKFLYLAFGFAICLTGWECWASIQQEIKPNQKLHVLPFPKSAFAIVLESENEVIYQLSKPDQDWQADKIEDYFKKKINSSTLNFRALNKNQHFDFVLSTNTDCVDCIGLSNTNGDKLIQLKLKKTNQLANQLILQKDALEFYY